MADLFFKYYDLDTRRTLNYCLNIDYLTFSVCKHNEYSGLTINSYDPLCFDSMECLDFFGPGG